MAPTAHRKSLGATVDVTLPLDEIVGGASPGARVLLPLVFLRLSCGSLCLNQQVLKPKLFSHHRQHFPQVLHPQDGSPDCLRSFLRMMGIDTQIKNARVPINRHDNFDFALR
jgi:hypothetical protein